MIAPANRTKFLKQKDLKEKPVTNNRDMKPEERSRNIELVWKYRRLWDAMSSFRKRRKRNKEYFHGNQWGDNLPMPRLIDMLELTKDKIFMNLEIKDPRVDLVFDRMTSLIEQYDFFDGNFYPWCVPSVVWQAGSDCT